MASNYTLLDTARRFGRDYRTLPVRHLKLPTRRDKLRIVDSQFRISDSEHRSFDSAAAVWVPHVISTLFNVPAIHFKLRIRD